jgi:hypothetical protein
LAQRAQRSLLIQQQLSALRKELSAAGKRGSRDADAPPPPEGAAAEEEDDLGGALWRAAAWSCYA